MDKASRERVVAFRQHIRELLKRRVTAAVEVELEEELSSALDSDWYERNAEPRGHRNGSTRRRITTRGRTRELEVPRGRIHGADGRTREFRSDLLSRYARRGAEVDEASLACYLSGANSRRIRKALAPLLGDEHLSMSSVSRVVARLKRA